MANSHQSDSSGKSKGSKGSRRSRLSNASNLDSLSIGEFAKRLAENEADPNKNSTNDKNTLADSHDDTGSERIRRENAARDAALKARTAALKKLKRTKRLRNLNKKKLLNKSKAAEAKKKAMFSANPCNSSLTPAVPPLPPNNMFPVHHNASNSSQNLDSSDTDDGMSFNNQGNQGDNHGSSYPPPQDWIACFNRLTTAVVGLKQSQDRIESHLASTQQNPAHTAQPTPQTGGSMLTAHSLQVPPDEALSDKIKQSIWDDKYVDFLSLIDKDDPSFSMNLDPTLGLKGISFEPKEKSKISLTDWKKAFNIYQSCYLKKFANTQHTATQLHEVSQQLLAYDTTILDMASKNYDWRFYDKQFRKNREFNHCLFNQRDISLYNDSINRSNHHEHPPLLPAQNRNSWFRSSPQKKRYPDDLYVPPGYCFAFHKPRSQCRNASNCSYRHSCFLCNAQHPASTCNGANPVRNLRAEDRADRRRDYRPALNYSDPSEGRKARKAINRF